MFSQLISTKDLQRSEIEKIFTHTQKMEKMLQEGRILTHMQNKIMAALFYEPSTRTRLSFETAMLKLGGKVINAIGMDNSSFQKGETLHDTIKTIENYADLIVMRHPEIGSATTAIQATNKPFLNAGDGAGEHPTQAILDAYTIQQAQGNLDKLTVGFIGDLKYGRTVHSLVYLLSHFQVEFIFISPAELKIPNEIKKYLDDKGLVYQETETVQSVLANLDVLYVTRIQKERFANQAEYTQLKDSYRIDANLVQQGKKNLSILHPLPRINEISTDVDNLPNATYFQQVKNSVPVRMALIDLALNH